MGGILARGLDSLTDHYTAACLALALVILSWVGVGDVRTVSLLGLLLCAAGLGQRAARADLWALGALVLYNLFSFASSFHTYGTLADGYASVQSILPVLYLLLACLPAGERRLLRQLCVLWTGAAGAAGILQFVWSVLRFGSAVRLRGILGSPNAMGIFLAVGWFALTEQDSEARGQPGRLAALLPHLEPLLLVSLTLTLSMGSFAAMAAGLLALLAGALRTSPREALSTACLLLAKASFGVGMGLLLYLAAARSGVPWLCLPVLAYILAAAVLWPRLEACLRTFPRLAAALSILGLLAAAGVTALRPSAPATFAERLVMMRNGLGYLTLNPLLGVGPYRWRLLNLQDGDRYFNTWHIHNSLLHVGVELGWIAMGALALAVLRFYWKKPRNPGGFTAFAVHNLMDTSFFYVGASSLTLLTACRPRERGTDLGAAALRGIFGGFAVLFACDLFQFGLF